MIGDVQTVRAGRSGAPGPTGCAGCWPACQVPSPPSSAAHTNKGRPDGQHPAFVLALRDRAGAAPPGRLRPDSEIGDELSISLSTGKTHIAALMRKLNARNRVEIVMWAYETRRVDT